MNYRTPFFLLLLVVTLLFSYGAAVAGEHSSFYSRATPKEEIAMTFYKLTGAEPDFEELAKISTQYERAKEEDKAEILRKRTEQLRQKYQNTPLQNTIITLTGLVKVRAGKKYNQDGLFIDFSASERPYFPFEFKEMNIALVLDGIENFLFIPMEKLEAQYIEHQTEGTQDAILFLEIKPWAADAEHIETMDGYPYFLMLGSIARFVLYTEQEERMWYYKADWYTTPSDSLLRRLYRKY